MRQSQLWWMICRTYRWRRCSATWVWRIASGTGLSQGDGTWRSMASEWRASAIQSTRGASFAKRSDGLAAYSLRTSSVQLDQSDSSTPLTNGSSSTLSPNRFSSVWSIFVCAILPWPGYKPCSLKCLIRSGNWRNWTSSGYFCGLMIWKKNSNWSILSSPAFGSTVWKELTGWLWTHRAWGRSNLSPVHWGWTSFMASQLRRLSPRY